MNNVILVLNSILGTANGEINNDWPSKANASGQSMMVLLFISIVLFFTYYFLKMSNKFKISKKSKNLEIIETIQVGYQSHIQLIRVAEKYILVGINKEKMTLLKEVDEIKINSNDEEKNINTVNFQDSFEKYIKKMIKKDNEDLSKNDKVK